ncbi:PE-PGRS family protein [Streptomyces sp. NPDC006235]|uniref:PE-PGRS family protein n=1 Tax=Streptomyces sp. NPDC006235 TaxID=3156736 RepID=UPI0033AA0D44
MSFRAANPEDLEQLAKLLDGRGGLEDRLDEAFTRAARLGVSGHLSPLKPMRSWTQSEARDLRKRAVILRLENGDPIAGLLWAGFTPKDLEQYKGEGIKPETLLLANSVAASDDPNAKELSRQPGEKLGDWVARLEAHALSKVPGLEPHEETLTEMIKFGADVFNVAAATQVVAASGFSGTKVLLGNAVKTGRLGPMKDALSERWSAPGNNRILRWAGGKLGNYNPPIRSLSAPGSWLPGQLGNMASRSQTYQRVANVPFSSGWLSDRWGDGWDKLRARGFMNSKLLGFTPNQAINFFAGSDDMARMYGGLTHSGQQVTRAGQASLWKVGKAGGFRAAAKTAGLWRGAGIVGSAGATVFSVANIATMDHAKEWKKSKAGYLANYAEAGFNASLTAAMVAPNPVTVGLAVGTGIVYGGLKVVEHWDDITEGAGKAADWVGDKASDIGNDIAGGAKKLGSALNPFD